MNTDKLSSNDLKNFLSYHLSVPISRLSDNTSFFHDLGIDGDDGADLLLEYSNKFQVNIDKFPIADYFGDEAALTLTSIYKHLFKKSSLKQMKRLTVKDLEDGIEKGVL